MEDTTTPAPDFAYRLAIILAGLAALIARRFLRNPLNIPLWTQVTHAAARLKSIFARLAAGHAPRPRTAKPHASGPYRHSVLPTRPAWLIHALGWEAAGYASQLQYLLEEPAAAAALANSLAARRALAPIRRMLGLTPPRPRRPRVKAPPPPPPPPEPVVVRPTPPAWLRDPPPQRTRSGRPYWLPPRRLRSG